MFIFLRKRKDVEVRPTNGKYDDYMFVKWTIKSCETLEQYYNAIKLIDYHYVLHHDSTLRDLLKEIRVPFKLKHNEDLSE